MKNIFKYSLIKKLSCKFLPSNKKFFIFHNIIQPMTNKKQIQNDPFSKLTQFVPLSFITFFFIYIIKFEPLIKHNLWNKIIFQVSFNYNYYF